MREVMPTEPVRAPTGGSAAQPGRQLARGRSPAAWVAGLLVLTGVAQGRAAPPEDDRAQDAERDEAPGTVGLEGRIGDGSSGPGVPEVEASRARLESGMTTLGTLDQEARGSGDAIRAACVEDRRKRAGEVLALATEELLIIRDPATGDQARTFAQEKLGAAADRMEVMVQEAQNCGQDTAPEDEDDRTRTDMDAPKTIPLEDPTGGLGENPVPPAVDTTWPFVASPTA